MSSETEEKKHPPSASKLRRSRREGRVAQSRDVVVLAVLPVLFWLVMGWHSFTASLKRLMASAFSADFSADKETLTHKLLPGFAEDVASIIYPIILVTILLVVLVAIVDMGGFVFSTKPITPDFSKLNPTEGFKKMFTAKTGIEMIIALIKMFAFSMFTYGIIYGGIEKIIEVQSCGFGCLPRMYSIAIAPLVALATLLYVFSAIADFLVSRAMFKREMRMTDTELKRDLKESYGNPEVKRRRKDEGAQLMGSAKRLGTAASTLMLYGQDEAIGIRYVAGETAAPVIVAKGKLADALEMVAYGRANGIPSLSRPTLARVLTDRGMKGQFVPADTFTDVASAIIASGN
jgi:type III secretion protein U